MKILIQHNQDESDISGVLRYIKAIVIGLKLREFEVRIVATRIYNFNYYVENILWADIVHLNSNNLAFALLAKLLGKKIIIKYHYPIYETTHFHYQKMTFTEQIKSEIIDSIPKANYPLIYKIYPIVRWARLCKRLATAAIADRHIAASKILSKCCVLPWKVETIYNPIEIPNDFKPKRLIDLSSPYTFLFAGRTHNDKGVDLLIKATRLLLEQRQDFQVSIIGEGRDLELFKNLASELDVLSHVNFFGKLSHEEVLKRIRNALALVYPSRWEEPVAYTVIEASSLQTCSIVSKMGVLPEVASPNSLFFENEDVKTLTNHLNYCLDNPEEVIERGLEARKYVAQKFTLKNSVNRLLAYC
ncbi:MAG: glycosyltransferase [Cyanobacteria bacterium P01_D01_bin.50]